MTREEVLERARKLAKESVLNKSREQIEETHKELNHLLKTFDLTWDEIDEN